MRRELIQGLNWAHKADSFTIHVPEMDNGKLAREHGFGRGSDFGRVEHPAVNSGVFLAKLRE
jgi:hypothetical protein